MGCIGWKKRKTKKHKNNWGPVTKQKETPIQKEKHTNKKWGLVTGKKERKNNNTKQTKMGSNGWEKTGV